jgi:hypothetical protein
MCYLEEIKQFSRISRIVEFGGCQSCVIVDDEWLAVIELGLHSFKE